MSLRHNRQNDFSKSTYMPWRSVIFNYLALSYPMITKKVIDELYHKYRKRPESVDALDIPLLFEHASEQHDIQIDDEGNLVIGSIDPRSPFRQLPLRNIHGISHFDDSLAIVLHSSILFLNKKDAGVNVHIRAEQPSLWECIRWKFAKA